MRVVYPKLDVKRSTCGVFTKEISTIYTRSIVIIHTRSAISENSVRLTEMDQIPVSEDEKLKVELGKPRGLIVGCAEVSSGVQDGDLRDGKEWGKTFVTMKKGGQINWDVSFNVGKGVKLTL